MIKRMFFLTLVLCLAYGSLFGSSKEILAQGEYDFSIKGNLENLPSYTIKSYMDGQGLQNTNPKFKNRIQPAKSSKYFVGINLGHTLVVAGVSMGVGNNVFYLPIRLNTHIALSNTYGISGALIFRYEQDGDFFKTNEIGFVVGPRYSFKGKGVDGFYVAAKIGLGFCGGTEYYGYDYYRIDFIINPEIGYVVPSKGNVTFIIGIGLQTLLPLADDASGWYWNDLGNLSHYYLPVVNLSVGFKK